MRDAIVAAVTRETEAALASGVDIPAIGENFSIEGREGTVTMPNDWLTVENGAVTAVDYENYLAFVAGLTPLKLVPAFDATANTDHQGLRGENSLFGGTDVPYASFTEYGWNNNQVLGDGSGPDDTGLQWADYVAQEGEVAQQLSLINPMERLGGASDAAPYWYLRHGMIDRDTSFAVELALYYAVLNDETVKDVSFKLPWMRPHSGNYDVQEAYAWLADKLAAASEH
jgi:hypothetical protein